LQQYLQSKNALIPPKKDDKSVFEHYINENAEWKVLNIEKWKPPKGQIQFSSILVTTVDSFRAKKLIDYVFLQDKGQLCSNAALLLGVAGSAKTSSILMFAE